ncbi:phospholipid methyltransferase [Aspergillus ellipticus CBS 707.79]|uniref:Phospholipid methyltransferase n=1 Tax=Aspergillus ellipticus CBS 707.79 TaxID=1448320 RepID=A0A319DB68_9EURO|nr:phospholipid methyltransferase [Aspergillus ellipticus CBS 707.79]
MFLRLYFAPPSAGQSVSQSLLQQARSVPAITPIATMTAGKPTTKEWVQSLMEPGQLLLWAMGNYIKVNIETVFLKGQILAPLLQSGRLRDEAFSRFWIKFSTNRESNINNKNDTPAPPAAPQLPKQIQCSSDLIPAILAHASGTVLDVGPGTGTQMPLLRSPEITSIYGAEPCLGLHTELCARAASEGLAHKYHILPCSVEASDLIPALEKEGLLSDTNAHLTARAIPDEGVFDTILCVRVLCSVPDIQRTICDLYALLRPGGKLLVVEHVVNPWRTAKGSVVARGLQALYGALGWSWYMGSCCLNRDTATALKLAAQRDGGWESVELERWFESTPMPYISGVFFKRGRA